MYFEQNKKFALFVNAFYNQVFHVTISVLGMYWKINQLSFKIEVLASLK